MSVSPISSSSVSGASQASGGHAAGRSHRKGQVQENYGQRVSALRDDVNEARRAAGGDPEQLAQIKADFQEK